MKLTWPILCVCFMVYRPSLGQDARTQVPSDEPIAAPGSIPSRTPIISAVPSSSFAPSQTPFATPRPTQPPSPQGAPCSLQTCWTFDSMQNLAAAIMTDFWTQEKFCLCPFDFRSAEACTGVRVDTIFIENGRNVHVTCASTELDSCLMGCSRLAFEIQRGSSLSLTGISFTGGRLFSRVLVSGGAILTGNNLKFFDTSVTDLPSRRDLVGEVIENIGSRSLQAANGNGAGILSFGELHLQDTVFERCVAAKAGGGIFSAGLVNMTFSRFWDNTAARGGALYAERGEVVLREIIVGESTSSLVSTNPRNSIYLEGNVLIRCSSLGIGGILKDTCLTSGVGFRDYTKLAVVLALTLGALL
jgi:hypothetical protein